MYKIINKIIYIIITTMFIGQTAFAKEINTIKYKSQLVIRPQFDSIIDMFGSSGYIFINGLALVSVRNKFGYINKTGQFVINPIYDEATDFNSSAAIVCIDKKCAVIDTSGKQITNFIFERPAIKLYGFEEGIGIVEYEGRKQYIDTKGNFILPNNYAFLGIFYNGYATVSNYINNDYAIRDGVIDKQGNLIVDFIFESISVFSEGYGSFGVGGKHGYIDTKGAIVIEAQFADAYPFSNGIAAVSVGKDCSFIGTVKCKYGFINKSGKFVINPIYDLVTSFRSGLAYVLINKKVGYIDRNGSEVIPIEYDDGSQFLNGFAKVEKNNKHGIIDTEGNIVVPLVYEDTSLVSEGMVGVKINGMWGFIKLDLINSNYL